MSRTKLKAKCVCVFPACFVLLYSSCWFELNFTMNINYFSPILTQTQFLKTFSKQIESDIINCFRPYCT